MVSSGTVNGDLSSIQSEFSSYTSNTSGLNGSWQGPSFDNFLAKTDNFISEFNSTIEGEMSSFAEACDLYERYVTARKNLETANYNVSEAKKAEDSSAASQWAAKASDYKTEMGNLKPQIEAALVAASSAKLEASTMNYSTSGGSVVASAMNLDGDLILSDSGYVFPFAKGVDAPITSHVGLRDAPTAGASSDHHGTDIGIPEGTEIHSLSSGTVINAGRGDAGGFGNWVRVQQDDGNVVIYGHVSKSDFYNVGDRVNAGDVVALSGNEGVSTGPHLHLEMHDANGNLLDSENYFKDVWT